MRLRRYIISEISIPALLSLLIFNFILLLGQLPKLANLVINKGVPLKQLITLLSYLLPTFLVITIPLSFMLGVILTFTRLSSDNEIIAMKASGVSLYQLLRPVLLYAVFASMLTALATLVVVPKCKHQFLSRLFDVAISQATVRLKPMTFNDEFNGFVIYANDIDDKTRIMNGVFISDQRSKDAPAVILAKSGRILSDRDEAKATIRLNEGTIQRRLQSHGSEKMQMENFAKLDINVDLHKQFAKMGRRYRKPAELPTRELIADLRTTPPGKSLTKYLVEFHQRLLLPFGPIIFALIGVPLGIQTNRSGKGSSFAMALAVFLLYYMFISIAQTLAEKLNFPVGLSLWVPSIILLLVAIYMNVMTAKERRFSDQLRLIFNLKGIK